VKDRLFLHLRRPVEIRCQGIIYRGVFMGADEEWIYLKGETTWLTLPMQEVTSFKPLEGPEQERVFRPVEGEEPLSPEEREVKRRHRKGEWAEVHGPRRKSSK
jgi:hypothetical protein